MKLANQHDVITAYNTLRVIGIIKRIHINNLHKQMVASGFDAQSSAKSIENAIANALMTFSDGYVSTRLDEAK